MSADKKEILVTKNGLDKIKVELEYLQGEKRQEIAEKIKTARDFGDISENSEYDDAKNEQADLEARIMRLNDVVKHAKIIEENNKKKDIVSIGTKVTVLDVEFDEEETYAIVGSTEADPYENKISNVSPVGSALIGKKVGEKIIVNVPKGNLEYEILKIV